MGRQTQRRTSRVLKCARGENIFNLWNPLSSLWMHFGMIWKELFIEMWMIQAAHECGWVEEPRRGQWEDLWVFGIVKRVPPKQKQALRALLQSKLNYLSFWDCLKSSFKTETGFRLLLHSKLSYLRKYNKMWNLDRLFSSLLGELLSGLYSIEFDHNSMRGPRCQEKQFVLGIY